ncbi:CmpA/NrtA family ABC transporter substrate-binding protein [Halomonas sp. 328]|uniref:CmpA/NrtA family ABC transporter substrate-binding protein n=1 Tax=Halomonas sp. 328 TaxID=2776704 RepID=UPI0018A7CB07|nr:CmpA/NrtA family ABC transporter substrate-binding protein [Halomonas sp. 328]MBF8223359.1 ABC transporter substrate-binding protein [Halomonas sp. 328]
MTFLPDAERPDLTLGFVPLLDSALLVIAREAGFFADQGLDVTLARQNTWSTLRDKVAAGLLDGAQMLAPLPLAMSLGLGRAPCETLAPVTLSRNGNALVLSERLAEASHAHLAVDPARSAQALAAALPTLSRPPRLAMVYPYSCQHYQLRHWLDLGGLDPDRDVELVVLPPPRMVDAMEAGEIDGFCVGEPWGSLAQHRGAGRIVATGAQLWPEAPEKVLGVTRSWARCYPTTLARLIAALHQASDWLAADPGHARRTLEWLALPPYLDRSVAHLSRLPLNETPIRQRLCGSEVLRPDPESAAGFAEHLDQALRREGRRLDLASLRTCHDPVHYDAALHQAGAEDAKGGASPDPQPNSNPM